MRAVLAFFVAVAMQYGMVNSCHAVVIPYGSLAGTNVLFNSISEDTLLNPNAAPNLFGAPSVMGNMLIFEPLTFEASQTGLGTEVTQGSLSVSLVAQSGSFITGILLEEFGDFAIAAVPFGDGGSVNGILTATAGSVSPAIAFFSATPTLGTNWNLDLPISLSPTSAVNLIVSNTLIATANSTFDDAFLKKKGFKITVTTTGTVPEPNSAIIFMVLGLAGNTLRRRHR